MKGISANVSRTLSHRDFPRVITHASGKPASRSRAETIRAIINELNIAPKARLTSSGWSRMFWMVLNFVKIPITGGIRIRAKNMMTAERYTVYFSGFFVDQRFSSLERSGTLMLLFFRGLLLKRKSK